MADRTYMNITFPLELKDKVLAYLPTSENGQEPDEQYDDEEDGLFTMRFEKIVGGGYDLVFELAQKGLVPFYGSHGIGQEFDAAAFAAKGSTPVFVRKHEDDLVVAFDRRTGNVFGYAIANMQAYLEAETAVIKAARGMTDG